MGYMRHHAIVVTTWNVGRAQKAHAFAEAVGAQASPVMAPVVNGYVSFFVSPDGSKEGWDDSDAGDEQRKKIVEYLRADDYLKWVEVQFGDDNKMTEIVSHSDAPDDTDLDPVT